MSRFDRSRFKTVDQLMEWLIVDINNTAVDNIYEFLEFEDYIQIRVLLESKENKPSIHDLGIISEINRDYNDDVIGGNHWDIIAKDILKLYRDRK